MLTKKDFAELAEMFSDAKEKEPFSCYLDADKVYNDLVEFCKKQNPKFNEEKFSNACWQV